MFQAAELHRSLDEGDYKARLPDLRLEALKAQWKLREEGRALLIIIEGIDGAGRGALVNRLNEWFDTRGIEVHTFWRPSDEERERPFLWRFWRSMPAKGDIGVFLGGWYRELITDALNDRIDHAALDSRLNELANFERMLVFDDMIIVKIWLHLPKAIQAKRLEHEDSTPDDRWPDGRDRALKHRKRFIEIGEKVLRESDLVMAPWYLIEASDERYRDVTVTQTIIRAINGFGAQSDVVSEGMPNKELIRRTPARPETPEASSTVLDQVDLTSHLGKKEYSKELHALQDKIRKHAWSCWSRSQPTVIVFEGWDAAGKGGVIRRLTQGLDARIYQVSEYGAPTEIERQYPYLWRFWRDLPRDGRILIFDRSWYGRVLVERVEGFAKPFDWQRAYREINQFEHELVRHGVRLLKFWLHIDKDEQLARFKDRESTPYKRYKITDEDWRNREKWDDYAAAVNEMVARTSTEYAPWHLIPANDKHFARVDVLRMVLEALKSS